MNEIVARMCCLSTKSDVMLPNLMSLDKVILAEHLHRSVLDTFYQYQASETDQIISNAIETLLLWRLIYIRCYL